MAIHPKSEKLRRRVEVEERKEAKKSDNPQPAARGELGVMIPGMGAVVTTFVAGVEAIRKGLAKPHRIAHPTGHRPS